jgi:hypothetical protein
MYNAKQMRVVYKFFHLFAHSLGWGGWAGSTGTGCWLRGRGVEEAYSSAHIKAVELCSK